MCFDDPAIGEPRSVWQGVFTIFGVPIQCHVLSDGRRIIESESFFALMQAMATQIGDIDTEELRRFSAWQSGPKVSAQRPHAGMPAIAQSVWTALGIIGWCLLALVIAPSAEISGARTGRARSLDKCAWCGGEEWGRVWPTLAWREPDTTGAGGRDCDSATKRYGLNTLSVVATPSRQQKPASKSAPGGYPRAD